MTIESEGPEFEYGRNLREIVVEKLLFVFSKKRRLLLKHYSEIIKWANAEYGSTQLYNIYYTSVGRSHWKSIRKYPGYKDMEEVLGYPIKDLPLYINSDSQIKRCTAIWRLLRNI